MTAEAVSHPAHYGGADNPYEVIKVLEAWLTRDEMVGFLKGNIIKYQARARQKAGAEDHAKSAWYAAYLAEFEKRKPASTATADLVCAASAARNILEGEFGAYAEGEPEQRAIRNLRAALDALQAHP